MGKTTMESIVLFIQHIIAVELKETAESVDIDVHFHEFGLDSINSTYLLDKVEEKYGVSLTPLYFWDYPTIALFAEQLAKQLNE